MLVLMVWVFLPAILALFILGPMIIRRKNQASKQIEQPTKEEK